MNIGTPLTRFDYGDPTGLFSLNVDDILGEEWGEIKDIEIITLKQHLLDLAADHAWTLTSNFDEIDSIAETLVRTKYTHAKEFVAIRDDKFIIGINASIINKQSIKYAFDLLANIEQLKTNKIVEFGELIEVYETD